MLYSGRQFYTAGLLLILSSYIFRSARAITCSRERPSSASISSNPQLKARCPGDGLSAAVPLASLNLSLDRLNAESRRYLPRLGVFQGGAMEDVLIAITGLGKTDEESQIAQMRKMLDAIQRNDHIALARAVGIEIPDGIELSEEQIEQLNQIVNQLKSLISQEKDRYNHDN